MIDKKTSLIISTNFEKGRRHDFRFQVQTQLVWVDPWGTTIYKESKLVISPEIQILADTAYKSKKYPEITTPHKKKRRSKLNPNPKLTKEQKKENREFNSKRVRVENVIGRVKILKILTDRYRNRRKRFGLRFNLVAGLCNWELGEKN